MSSGNMVRHITTREATAAYVNAHPDEFEDFEGLTLEQCVAEVDRRRAAGLDTAPVETWLLARFESQTITGVLN